MKAPFNMEKFSAKSAVEFLLYGNRLKRVSRGGWLLKGIKDPESVAEHCYGTGMMALILARAQGLDELQIVRTALLHDIGESVIGDIIWEHGAQSSAEGKYNKHLAEVEAVRRIFKLIGHEEAAAMGVDFLEQTTPEAWCIKEADKLEMLVQALEYEQHVKDPNVLVEFWENVAVYIKSDTAWQIFDECKRRSRITLPLPSRP
jgi:5'-deoxynucleotidase YfbR-like HD superfamily hydrolase